MLINPVLETEAEGCEFKASLSLCNVSIPENKQQSQMWWYKPLVPHLGNRQVDLCESESSLVLHSEFRSRTDRAM